MAEALKAQSTIAPRARQALTITRRFLEALTRHKGRCVLPGARCYRHGAARKNLAHQSRKTQRHDTQNDAEICPKRPRRAIRTVLRHTERSAATANAHVHLARARRSFARLARAKPRGSRSITTCCANTSSRATPAKLKSMKARRFAAAARRTPSPPIRARSIGTSGPAPCISLTSTCEVRANERYEEIAPLWNRRSALRQMWNDDSGCSARRAARRKNGAALREVLGGSKPFPRKRKHAKQTHAGRWILPAQLACLLRAHTAGP